MAEVPELKTKLEELASVYDGIKLTYNFVEPTTDTTKKITYINSTTTVDITEHQLTQISEKVSEIRNKIITTTQS
jgi:hypothetical protein